MQKIAQKITPSLWFDGRAEEAMASDPDPAKASRIMQAMLTMDELDIARLTQAHDSGPA